MQPLDLPEIHALLLEILRYVDATCRREGLHYSLCGGTLLGAIREGGFIPWDDDADIMMPRADYERFLSIARVEGRYTLLARRFQPDYYYHFAKLAHPATVMREDNVPPVEGMGVFLDIFPADPFPKGQAEIDAYMRKLTSLRRKWWHAVKLDYAQDASRAKRAAKRLLLGPYAAYCRARGIDHWYRQIDAMLHDPRYQDSPVMGFPVGSYKERDIFAREMFAHYIDVPFACATLMAIRDYDAYLTSLYGDYMTPPPPGKRKVHGFPAYWKDSVPPAGTTQTKENE